MKILLIEPDLPLAKTYSASLQAAGHDVTACAGAQSAIFAADQQLPDLIIMEIQLVGHSGIEFLYELRSYTDWQNIPIIIQSLVMPSEFSGGHDILFNELGINKYLYKPRTSLHNLINYVQIFSPVQL